MRRFSLAMLMLSTLVLGVMFGLIGRDYQLDRRNDQLLEVILSVDGKPLGGKAQFGLARRLFGQGPRQPCVGAYIEAPRDETLQQLAALNDGRLEVLACGPAPITDIGLAAIATFTSLETLKLDLTRAEITPAALAGLRTLIRLTTFECKLSANADDALVESLAGTGVTRLMADGATGVTFAGLDVSGFVSLQSVWAGGTGLNDAGVERLAQAPALAELLLDRTAVSDRGCRALGQAMNLRRLDLTGTNITDEGLQQLRTLSSLHTFACGDTRVTRQGLAAIEALPIQLLDRSSASLRGWDRATRLSDSWLSEAEQQEAEMERSERGN